MKTFDEIYEQLKNNHGFLLVHEGELPSEILSNDNYNIRAQKNEKGISYYDVQQSFSSVRRQKENVNIYQKSIIQHLITEKNISVLDAGTGTGIEFKKFIEKTNEYSTIDKAVAIDLSQGMVDEAKKNLKDIADVYKKDMTNTYFKNELFDLIRVSNGTLGHLNNNLIEKGLNHFYDLLKPDGILLFDVMSKDKGILNQMSKNMGNQAINLVYFVPLEENGNCYLRQNMNKKESHNNKFIVGSIRLFSNNDITSLVNQAGFSDINFKYISWDNNSENNSVFNIAYVIKK